MKIRALLTIVMIGFRFGIVVQPVQAHMSVAGEIYSNTNSSSHMDPVNVIFTSFNGGYDGNWPNVQTHVAAHTGWGNAIIGSDMYFLDHGYYLLNIGQMASPCCGFQRWHVRFGKLWNDHRDTSGWVGTYTSASIHHDGFVYCGHVGEKFDQARNYLTDLVGRAPDHSFSAPGTHFYDRKAVVNCDGSVHYPDVATNFVWM